METQPKRQTAYKVWISDLINHEFIKQQGEWDPNYVQLGNKRISRVNVIATVIDKTKTDDNSYTSLIIDDGSESISVKAWRDDINLIDNIEIGSAILLIGRVREYNNQIYLTPEIVRPITNLNWVELRKKELMKEYGTPTKFEKVADDNIKPSNQEEFISESLITEEDVIEESNTESDRQKLLSKIDKMNSDNGINTEDIISDSGLDENKARSIIQELLKEGEIFEIAPGKVKIIE